MPSLASRFVVPLLFAVVVAAQQAPEQPAPKPLFKLQEVMIPVRDGVHLQTVIFTPVDQAGPLPILFRRTPYGVPAKPPEQMPSSMKELAQDGYIFVFQDIRGRFTSEYHVPLEMVGLYWHFIDIVWVFLYPLLYLVALHK